MIEIRGLTKKFTTAYDTFTALSDVNLSIEDGEIFGIIGMSGAGKSTLVRCINLLEKPDKGSIIINGCDLTALSEKKLRCQRRDISMIFQQFNLLMQKTCLKNVCFPMEIASVPREKAKARAMELLEIVGLPDKALAYPAQLSGGQKQRVAIARALASNPKVLMCDEATSALDPRTTRSILSLIADINKRLNITVIIITHEMAVIEAVCSRVAILDKSRVVECGKVEDIFANPKTEAARRLFYPDAQPETQKPSSGTLVRLVFEGGTSYEPLIASLAIDCGVKVNILGADTRNINGKAFGTMLLGLPDNPVDAAKVFAYIKQRPHIRIEEVRDNEHGA
ncbi:MAG: ATP-binding cassette domain-containing protein [Clostridia bacterium]|nr:ATP-binding cassette domain-containing protein [Clostridia bacterium]